VALKPWNAGKVFKPGCDFSLSRRDIEDYVRRTLNSARHGFELLAKPPAMERSRGGLDFPAARTKALREGAVPHLLTSAD